MEWLADKTKEGETYTNTLCFTWCLKCFPLEQKVELYHRKKRTEYTLECKTRAETLFIYRIIKGLKDKDITKYAKKHMRKK